MNSTESNKGLTAAGRRLQHRQKDLQSLRLPGSISVEIDLHHGLAHFHINKTSEHNGTLADLGPNGSGINIDVGKNGELQGLEDISALMGQVVSNWITALLKAKKMMDLRHNNPQKYQEQYGHKTHFVQRFPIEDNPIGGFRALCGNTNSYTLVEDETKWQEVITKGCACLRCQKLREKRMSEKDGL